ERGGEVYAAPRALGRASDPEWGTARRHIDQLRLLPSGHVAGAARSYALRGDRRPATKMGAWSDPGPPRPVRILWSGGAAPGRLVVRRRARASRARDPDVVA